MLFNPNPNCQQTSILQTLQDYVQNIVVALLILSVVLLGIKISLKGEVPHTGEIFAFILKIGTILYFCVGTGLTDLVYTGGMALLTELPNYTIGASTNFICNYKASYYPDGYSYLLTWDILDCRILHYLGMGIANSAFSMLGLITILLPAFFVFQIIFGLLLICYGIFVLSLAASFLYSMVIAMVGLAILTYLGLICIPMMLFEYTHSIYSSWWKLTLSFALQPVIFVTVISLVFAVFDNLLYNGCTMSTSPSSINGSTTNGNSTTSGSNPPSNFNGVSANYSWIPTHNRTLTISTIPTYSVPDYKDTWGMSSNFPDTLQEAKGSLLNYTVVGTPSSAWEGLTSEISTAGTTSTSGAISPPQWECNHIYSFSEFHTGLPKYMGIYVVQFSRQYEPSKGIPVQIYHSKYVTISLG